MGQLSCQDIVLIETYWNVKSLYCILSVYLATGINRNILECKVPCDRRDIIAYAVLIETYWNVKYAITAFPPIPFIGINRNILECKGLNPVLSAGGSGGINRNILECKVKTNRYEVTIYSVLIETYWNVKNFKLFFTHFSTVRINRNILECKVWRRKSKRPGIRVLIETYWNVKASPALFTMSENLY